MNANKARVLRTFFALWPDPQVRRTLAEQALAAARSAGGRATRAEALHLTLVFNGATMPDKLGALTAVMDSIRLPAFELRLDRTGWFRGTGVAWLGAAKAPAELIELQDALARGASRVGFGLDVRPYVPHLTLARHARRAPPALIGGPLEWPVASFALVASELLPDGPRYRILHETRLAESGAREPGAAKRVDATEAPRLPPEPR